MEYRLNQDQLYKIMKLFFDSRFKNSKLEIRNYEGEKWKGIWSPDGELLVGSPSEGELHNYYFNGGYFSNEWDMFSIDIVTFIDMMELYLEKEYDLKINSLS